MCRLCPQLKGNAKAKYTGDQSLQNSRHQPRGWPNITKRRKAGDALVAAPVPACLVIVKTPHQEALSRRPNADGLLGPLQLEFRLKFMKHLDTLRSSCSTWHGVNLESQT